MLYQIAGCEFGDRASWCSQSNSLSNSCTDPGFASTCCKSCASITKNSAGNAPSGNFPAKGDLLGDCSSKRMDQCYTLAGSCCTTCQSYYTNIKGRSIYRTVYFLQFAVTPLYYNLYLTCSECRHLRLQVMPPFKGSIVNCRFLLFWMYGTVTPVNFLFC